MSRINWSVSPGGILTAACWLLGCSSTAVHSTDKSDDCVDMDGQWIIGECLIQDCKIKQAGCGVVLTCNTTPLGSGTATGVIEKDQFTFESDDSKCSGVINGDTAFGNCVGTEGGGQCSFTAERQ